MQRYSRIASIVFVLIMLISPLGNPVPTVSAASWQEKVDPWVLSTAQAGETEFLVFLSAQADLDEAATLKDKNAKGTYVYETLTSTTAATQKSLRTSLDTLGVSYKSYWVVNAFWVRGDLNLIQTIAQRSDVAHIYANPQVKLSLPEQEFLPAPLSPTAIEWNITHINADDVWAAGYTGQNVVIGGADTGYDWDHPAIINQYRGWNGVTADHDYNWHDATAGSVDIPVDPYGHGTHTMGTMVGDDGSSNQIGVAPGARWIGCRNMDAGGNGTPARYIECYQWFIAPTRTDGSDPNPALAPHVINNSWGCPPSEGCTDLTVLLTAVQNLRAAGILTVHSAGNEGSSCNSVQTPAAIYAESFSVAATNSGDTVAGFSSRGPVTVDGSNRRKPDISAPGVSIRSCVPGTGYSTWQGTSMAAPHIAGVVGLLISAKPTLAGQVETLETIIEQTAVPLYTTQGCGDDTPGSHPNNVYGWGRVDAWAAYQAIPSQELAIAKTVSTMEAAPGSVLTYTLTVTNSETLSSTHNIILEDVLPQYTNFITATGNITLSDDTVTWALGDLPPSAYSSVELVIQVQADAPAGSIVNDQYSAYSDEANPVIGDPVTTYIHGLYVQKSAPRAVMPGAFIVYNLEVTNQQPDVSTHNVTLEDSIPPGTDFVSATGSYSMVGDLVTWDLGDLGPSVTSNVELTVQVPMTAPLGTIVNNQYSAQSDEAPLVSGAPVSTVIHLLDIEKSGPEMVVGGYPLTYTLTVTNLQPTASTHNLTLTDTLPAGTDFIAASGSYSLVGDLVTWDLGVLGASAKVQVNLVVSVSLTSTETITNAHYGAISDEVTTPARGNPVSTFVHWPELLWVADTTCNNQWLMPGAALTCHYQLHNTGNYTDTFALSAMSTKGNVEITPNGTTLGSGQSKAITLTLTIPGDVIGGETITTTLSATSASDPAFTEALTITSWIYERLYLPLIASGQ